MATRTLKVLTYNLHKGFAPGNRRFVLHEMREALLETGADVLFLQEIQGRHEARQMRFATWPESTQAEFLAEAGWDHHHYAGHAIYAAGHHGNAILSRFPLEEVRDLNLARWRFASRSLVHAVIRPDSLPEPLHLVCVHLDLIGFERRRQFRVLNRYLLDEIPRDAPLVLAGDFNDWTGRATLHLDLRLGLREVFQESRGTHARTFPVAWPVLTMDRIYYRGLELESAHCFTDAPWRELSDHAPLWASFELEA
ncbi:MAG: EEP domain-containing protein [Gammaproteobacteria bacterium]|nr:MAG: EEP domain-containing protein [Gammaproteobacteria bacterium]